MNPTKKTLYICVSHNINNKKKKRNNEASVVRAREPIVPSHMQVHLLYWFFFFIFKIGKTKCTYGGRNKNI